MKNDRPAGDKSLPAAFFTQIPKAELHCHLDGSLRESTLNELAKVKHVTIPPAFFGQVHASLEKYLERFSVICAVMQTREAIYRVAYELVEDGARENIWHMEARFCPTLLVGEGLTLDQITQAAIDGGNEAARKYGVSYGVILTGVRSFKPAVNLEIAKVAAKFKDHGVIGYDLAGPEEGYPAKDHAEAFVHVMSHYMHTTVHAGESYGPDSIEQSLTYCGAQRIGHGTRLFERPDLLRYVVDKRIPLEVCLTSNEQTGAVESVAKHPLRQYLDAGVRATLCTDNRLVSNTTLSREYERANVELGLGYPQLKTLSINGFKSAFIPHRQKGDLLVKVNEQWREIEKEFGL
jgi:adenosine deaminase